MATANLTLVSDQLPLEGNAMDYQRHIGRTFDLFLCFVLTTLAGLNVFFRFPELAILVSVVVGCAAVWVIANYISITLMIYSIEKTA